MEWLRAPLILTNRKYTLVELERWRWPKTKDGNVV